MYEVAKHFSTALRQNVISLLLIFVAMSAVQAAEPEQVQREDYFVPVISTAPSMSGRTAQLYVRERVTASTRAQRNLAGRVVLFVHGAGTPAEVAFDVPVEGYSWMAYLAESGFDTFSLDLTGYGPSSRPPVMNNRCNLSAEQQRQVFGNACDASYPLAATTMASDWHDINAVVDFLLELRDVDSVHLVGWSQGGPRTIGYAALYPDKVDNIVVLAPAYNRNLPAALSDEQYFGSVMTKQSQSDFITNWDRQTGCRNQYDTAVRAAVWREMLASDPVGSTWGSGVRRAPRVPTFGWTPEVVHSTLTPVMVVAGMQDAQVVPERVRELFEDLGSPDKWYLEMPCSSHNAMWERDAQALFEASRQWLEETAYEGEASGFGVIPTILE